MNTHHTPRSRSRWLGALAGAGALSALLAINVPVQAHPSAGDGTPHARHGAAGEQRPDSEPGRAHGRHFGRHIERVFAKVGASDEQKARAREILRASEEQMKTLHAGHADERSRTVALLSADTIDRSALEQQRAARVAHMDEASKLMTRTLADLAEVLTPAQRKDAAPMLAGMGGHGPRHGKGGHHRPHGDGAKPAEAPRG